MTAIKKLYEFAALSQAAYGYLPERPTDRQAQEVLVRTLETDIGEENRFVLSQAQRLIGATGYSVLHHQANDSWGFSAMVVRDNRTGEKSIVFRGTEAGLTEIDTLGSNVQIALAGVARDQIFSMWNYFQRLIAPEGAPVAQWVPTPASPNPAFPIASPVRPYSLVSGAATGLGVLTPGEQVDLAGHSLGGHLAIAFSRLFPVATRQAYVFNSAGFYNSIFAAQTFAQLGGLTQFDASRVTNVFAYPDLEIVTNDVLHNQIGARVPIFTEWQASVTGNHAQRRLADSLAVYELFERIQADVSRSTVSSILEAASGRHEESIETTLNAMQKLYAVAGLPLSPDESADGASDSVRNSLYARIYELQDAIQLKGGGLVVSMSLLGQDDIIAAAHDGTGAYRYALRELSPFIVLNNASLYQSFNADARNGLYDGQTGIGLTEEWIKDRTEFLAAKMRYGVKNGGTSAQIQKYYEDRRSPTDTFTVGTNLLGVADRLIFGHQDSDSISGGVSNDRLYGGDGADVIVGGLGNDYIEGNEGQDSLRGGRGRDTLFGGNDTDALLGDAGYDVYYAGAGDTIHDTGGTCLLEGRVYLSDKGNTLLTGGDWDSVAGVWRQGDITYRRSASVPVNLEVLYVPASGGAQVVLTIERYFIGASIACVAGEEYTFLDIALRNSPKPPRGSAANFSNARQFTSPIILDLDGDGVETIGQSSDVFFDHGGAGLAQLTGWVAADDGLLVYDRDGDGTISDGAELFGSKTPLPDGTLAPNGFIALGALDLNADGRIDADDPVFSLLQVWKDANQNGEAESWELTSLSANNVASISTLYDESTFVDVHGNEHRQYGTFTLDGGATRSAVDVWFSTSRGHTREAIPTDIPEDVEALPEAKGFGEVQGLRAAMTSNATLKALIQQYMGTSDPVARDNQLDGILYEWAGSAAVDPASRGPSIDARLLVALERFAGEGFRGQHGDPTPTDRSAEIIRAQFDDVRLFLRAQLLAQTHDKAAFDLIQVQFDPSAAQFAVNLDAFTNYLTSLVGAGNAAKAKDLYSTLRGLELFDGFMTAPTEQIRTHATLGPLVVASVITGTAASEKLDGSPDEDLFEGLGGSDRLSGGAGNDTYRFSPGFGNDVIFDTSGSDILQFLSTITPSSVRVVRRGDELEVTIVDGLGAPTGDKITVGGYFSSFARAGTSSDGLIETILFADSSTWGVAQVLANLPGPTSADDEVYGTSGDDTLQGLGGNDLLFGGDGNDLYRFSAGDGGDTIDDLGGSDRIEFGAGARLDRMRFTYANGRNTIQLLDATGAPTGDSIAILFASDYGVRGRGWIESIQVDDGTGTVVTLDTSQISARFLETSSLSDTIFGSPQVDLIDGQDGHDLLYGMAGSDTLRGSAGNDTLYGDTGHDTLEGGSGSDWLYGGAGNDVLVGGIGNDALSGGVGNDFYVFDAGFGVDSISGEGSDAGEVNVIQLPTGVTFAQIAFRRTFSTLEIVMPGGSDVIQIFGQFSNAVPTNSEIDEIRVWDAGLGAYATVTAAQVRAQVALATPGTDTLWGYDTDDTLDGLAGNDVLYGGGGSDTLTGGLGNDTLSGGAGADLYRFSPGDGQDWIVDAFDVGGSEASIVEIDAPSTSAVARRVGSGADLHIDLGSADRVTIAGFFADPASLGAGLSEVRFTDVSWNVAQIRLLVLSGGAGIDYINGYGTDDTLAGNDGNDELSGLGGNDVLLGGGGNDRLWGGDGNDTLDGGTGVDELDGGFGDDRLLHGETLRGYAGNDTYVFEVGGGGVVEDVGPTFGNMDVIELGVGILPGNVAVSRSGSNLVLSIPAGGSIVVNSYFNNIWGEYATIEEIRFTDPSVPANERVWNTNAVLLRAMNATEGVDVISGLANVDDTIVALGGNDTLNGDSGNDVLNGGRDDDVISGEAGHDTLLGESGADRLFGGDGDDVLMGGSGADTLQGNAGNDTMSGGPGRDVYEYPFGSLGADLILSDPQDLADWDVVRLPSLLPKDVSLSRGAADLNDLVITVRSGGESITIDDYFATTYGPQWSRMFVQFSSGGSQILWDRFDVESMVGAAAAHVTLTGSSGADTFSGGNGNDVFAGGQGNDLLQGGRGHDNLAGDDGNDVLVGGAGDDVVNGGLGNDTYQFGRGADQDVISNLDASAAVDQLLFDADVTPAWNHRRGPTPDVMTCLVAERG